MQISAMGLWAEYALKLKTNMHLQITFMKMTLYLKDLPEI